MQRLDDGGRVCMSFGDNTGICNGLGGSIKVALGLRPRVSTILDKGSSMLTTTKSKFRAEMYKSQIKKTLRICEM